MTPILSAYTNIPTSERSEYCPLVVGLHGGTYSNQYYDVDLNHTAAIASNGAAIPFVAIDRPGYAGSSSISPDPEGSTYQESDGACLHQFILPALWAEFGAPNGCNSIVLFCHSLGRPRCHHRSGAPRPRDGGGT